MPRTRYNMTAAGYYETSRMIDGKRVRFRGKTCAEVDRKLLAYQQRLEVGRTYAEVLDDWFATRERDIARATFLCYTKSIQRLKEYFVGNIAHVKAIRPVDVLRYIRAFEAQGYARSTVNTELTVIKQSMSFAVLAGDIDVSPAAEVRKSHNLPTTERRALTEEQEIKVENCRSGEHWLLGLMLLYTGCRRGELLALNWQDIDRRAGVIHVTKKLNWSYGNRPHLEHRLKSENGKRDVPLFSALADALPDDRRLGPIFTDDDGNYYSISRLRTVWTSYCRDAGLLDDAGDPSVTPHQFRHSFATICFEAGIDTKSFAAFLGDTEEVAAGVYAELRSRHHVSSAERVDAFLEMRRGEREQAAE